MFILRARAVFGSYRRTANAWVRFPLPAEVDFRISRLAMPTAKLFTLSLQRACGESDSRFLGFARSFPSSQPRSRYILLSLREWTRSGKRRGDERIYRCEGDTRDGTAYAVPGSCGQIWRRTWRIVFWGAAMGPRI